MLKLHGHQENFYSFIVVESIANEILDTERFSFRCESMFCFLRLFVRLFYALALVCCIAKPISKAANAFVWFLSNF